MSKKLVSYLLRNISIFNEIQLPTILNYIELYDPKSEEEINETITILDKKFKSQSLSIVLAISKIYLKYGKIVPELM